MPLFLTRFPFSYNLSQLFVKYIKTLEFFIFFNLNHPFSAAFPRGTCGVLLFCALMGSVPAWGQSNPEGPTEEVVDRDPQQAQRRAGRGAPRNRTNRPDVRKENKNRAAQVVPLAGAVSKINIAGNKKIEADAIRARLKTKVGDSLNRTTIREDIASIFKMGYFHDVRVDRSGNELTYSVVEKPSVVEILYDGNDEISDDDLKEASALKPYEILDMGKISEAIAKMQKSYEDKGYFLAKISSKIEEVDKTETVRLRFVIDEGEKVRVKKITILGNKNLTDSKLKGAMITQEGGFFSFLSGSGAYKQDAFDRDVQVLSFLYFNEGYVQVKVDRPQVYVTPDKRFIYVTLRVEEGQQYDVGDVDFAGDLLFSKEDLFTTTEIQRSKIFVYDTLQKDLRGLQAKYGDLGYAFANIIPRTQIREKERKVDITFEVDKGQKVYFGEFTVVGNNKTRDKVLRRELKIKEGELYNETRKRQSIENVRRLGFFDDVAFNQSTPPDKTDVLNVEIQVKERNTGTLQVGAAYSSGYGGASFNGKIEQTNLFGKGQRLSLNLNFALRESVFSLSFTEPYFNDTLWSVGGDLYIIRRDQVGLYDEKIFGGAARVGYPLAEYLMGYVKFRNDFTQIDLAKEADPVIYPVNTANGWTRSLTFSLDYDKRDDRFSPTSGFAAGADFEYAGLGGLQWTEVGASVKYFKTVIWDLVWRNRLQYGYLTAPSDRSVPFNKVYRLGGANSLRGFPWYSVGKKKTNSKGEAFVYGGNQTLYYTAELEYPLIEEAKIKGVLFYDTGMADDDITKDSFKSDVGFGFRWFSPIGPLRFEWGFPIFRSKDDPPNNFEFFIGSPF